MACIIWCLAWCKTTSIQYTLYWIIFWILVYLWQWHFSTFLCASFSYLVTFLNLLFLLFTLLQCSIECPEGISNSICSYLIISMYAKENFIVAWYRFSISSFSLIPLPFPILRITILLHNSNHSKKNVVVEIY